jgi:cytidyltransferase-like protein
MVDLSATLLHHGHIRLLKNASEFGVVIVALTTDEQIYLHKGYKPELTFEQRREILLSIKYVTEVYPSNWIITNEFLLQKKCDYLFHGNDNTNLVGDEFVIKVSRTPGISSSELRRRACRIIKLTEQN